MQNPKVKDVILTLGLTGFVAASMIFPALPLAAKPYLDYKRKKEYENQKKLWNKYNPYILRQTIKRLREQKVVEFLESDNEPIIKLTQKGKTKILRYKIEQMHISNQTWDGKWRLIIYDVPVKKRARRDLFRRFIKRLNLYPLQESVYLTPFKCKDEIEYLKQIFSVDKEVIYLTVEKFENDTAYRQYFGL